MLLKTGDDKMICPKCKKAALDTRTKRGLLVKTTLFWLPIKRYKCHACLSKTYVYDHTGKAIRKTDHSTVS